MHKAKTDLPARIDAPGAVARQGTGFGDAGDLGGMSGEQFEMAAGTDITPLLEGLDGDRCQVPHWGYVLSGEVVVSYDDDAEERDVAGDLFYWPPGHTVRVVEDAELVMFSPAEDHAAVLDHMCERLDAAD